MGCCCPNSTYSSSSRSSSKTSRSTNYSTTTRSTNYSTTTRSTGCATTICSTTRSTICATTCSDFYSTYPKFSTLFSCCPSGHYFYHLYYQFPSDFYSSFEQQYPL